MAGACRVGRCSADRVGAAVARAGIHARHLRIGDTDRASTRRAPRSGPARARSRAHRAIRRSRGSRVARSAGGPVHRRDSRRPAGGGFLRVVLDLKSEIRPQVFALKPVAEFGHRLIIDLYPVNAVDPLMALLDRERADTPTPAPAGHGTPTPTHARCRAVGRRFAQDTVAANHRRDRSRPRRRGSRCRRSPRNLREERRARDRAQAQTESTRSRHARDADARRRLLRSAGDAREESAARAGGPLRVDPCRRVSRIVGSRLVGVRAFGSRRDQRRRTLARPARERGRPDRRRQPGRQ